MSDENDEAEEEPPVQLGEGEAVEGAPLARVAERLTWGIQKSEIDRREGDTEIRTPDGPRELSELLAEVEDTYFESRRHFESTIREVTGVGPVPTTGEPVAAATAEGGEAAEEETEE
ncbi:DUF5789 family protein [Halospeciosus flavus]|uniref:DUF5789 family protein n=1 Tax=Halospeciosus flavus TaxID=3032283 RepID=A0ABD5Z5C6_9EURY